MPDDVSKLSAAQRAALFQKVFTTTDGKKVLEILEAEMTPEFHENPQRQSFHLGQYDVIQQIKAAMEMAKEC